MAERPVWLLDVDGVLSVDGKPGWSAPPRTRTAVVNGRSLRIRWAPSLIDAVSDLLRSGLVEVRWATSWVDRIEVIERMMGLPALPLAFEAPGQDLTQEVVEPLKRAAAVEVVTSGRRLLWTDDDAIWPEGPHREALEATGSLLITPDPKRGLQRADIAAIRQWLGA